MRQSNRMERIGRVELELSTGEVHCGDRSVRLGLKPFELLRRLAQSRGRLIGRNELTAALWPDQAVGETALGSVVREIRRALKALEVAEDLRIEAVRGRGYRLIVGDLAGEESSGLASPVAPPKAFVGRDEELDRLVSAFDGHSASPPRILVVSGAAGVGKSRLVQEFQQILSARGIQTLPGQCFQGETIPFGPWAQIIRAFSRSYDEELVRSILRPLAPDLARALPSVGALFDELAPPVRDDPELARLALFDCFVELIERVVQRTRCVLVLDDVQWADASSLHVLLTLVAQPAEHRFMLVATQRTDETHPSDSAASMLPDLMRREGVERLRLNPLSQSDSRRLLAGLGARDETAPRWAEICTASEGNPFFLREMYLHEQEAPPGLVVPPNIERLLLRRLEHRSPSARDLITLAAVIGTEVDEGILMDLEGGGDTPVDGPLLELVRAGLLTARQDAPGAYRFAHGLIREAIYAQTPPSRRARLHLAVAESVERRVAEAEQPLDDDVSALAHHFECAQSVGGASRAFHYRVSAGEVSSRQLAFEDVVFHFSRAVALLDANATTGERPEICDDERCDLLLRLADAARKAGDGLVSEQAVAEALPLARALDDPQYLVRLAASIPCAIWQDAKLTDLQEEALGRLDKRPTKLRALALAGMAQRLSDVPGARARRGRLIDEALEITASDDGRSAREYVLEAYLNGQLDRRDLDERERHATEWLALGRREGGAWARAQGHLFRHAGFLQGGRLADARAELAQIDTLALRHRWPRLHWLSDGLHFAHAFLDARLDEAEGYALRAAELADRSRLPLATMTLALQLPFLRREQRRLPEMVDLVEGFVASTPAFDWALELVRGHLEDHAALLRLLEATFTHGSGLLRHDADMLRMVALCWLCDECSLLNEHRWADQILRELSPAADGWPIAGPAGFYSVGNVRHFFGVCELLRGRPRVAVREHERALESHSQRGATLRRLWTTYELARALRARGWKKDEARIARMIDDTHSEAARLGLALLQNRIEIGSRVEGRSREGPPAARSVSGGDEGDGPPTRTLPREPEAKR